MNARQAKSTCRVHRQTELVESPATCRVPTLLAELQQIYVRLLGAAQTVREGEEDEERGEGRRQERRIKREIATKKRRVIQ